MYHAPKLSTGHCRQTAVVFLLGFLTLPALAPPAGGQETRLPIVTILEDEGPGIDASAKPHNRIQPVPLARPVTSATHVRGVTFTPEREPNNSSVQATAIPGSPAILTANIYPDDDVDFFSFTAAAGDRVYAAVMTGDSLGGSDSLLEVMDTDGTTVRETDDDDGWFGLYSSSIAGTVLPISGTYFLRMQPSSIDHQLRPYEIYFQLRSGSPVAETEPNGTFPGQALPASGWVEGAINSVTDVDYFSLPLNAGDTVFLSLDLDPERDATEWNGLIGFGPFGPTNEIFTVNDPGSATPDSEAYFMTTLSAGTYTVLVGLPAGGVTFGTYHLSVTVFPAADPSPVCATYTSTDVPITIPTGPGSVSSTLTVPGHPRIADLDVHIELTHNRISDLCVHLISPANNDNSLFRHVGSPTAGVNTQMNLTLDDEAGIPVHACTFFSGMTLKPDYYSLNCHDGEDAGGVWTLVIFDDKADNGGTLVGWSIRICEPPAPPACPASYVSEAVFSTDFEDGTGGFTHSGYGDEWERGLPSFAPITDCNSGVNCWKTDLDNTYDNLSNSDLVSPPISLADHIAPVIVEWAHRFQVCLVPLTHYYVDIRQVGSPANSQRLYEWLGLDLIWYLGGTAIQNSVGWGVVQADVSAFAGLNVELVFHLDATWGFLRCGVAIDDVSVTACRLSDADLFITKTDGVETIVSGKTITYTITAANAGPDPVTGATVTDMFPATLTGVTWTCTGSGGATCGGAGAGDITDTVNLPAGASVTYTVTATVDASATGTLSNTAIVTSTATDPDPANNQATDTTSVLYGANLVASKTVSGTFTVGGSATYTIVLTNNGPGPQGDNPGHEFNDVLPAELTLESRSATSGVIGSAGNTVYWDGTLAAGASVAITIQANIVSGAGGSTVTNQGTAFFDRNGDGANEASVATDDPALPGTADSTPFIIQGPIPALSGTWLILLFILLGGVGVWLARRQ